MSYYDAITEEFLLKNRLKEYLPFFKTLGLLGLPFNEIVDIKGDYNNMFATIKRIRLSKYDKDGYPTQFYNRLTKERSHFFYNDKRELTRTITDSYRLELNYTSLGLLESEKLIDITGKKEVLAHIIEYSYDDLDLLISEKKTDNDGLCEVTEYYYNSTMDLLTVVVDNVIYKSFIRERGLPVRITHDHLDRVERIKYVEHQGYIIVDSSFSGLMVISHRGKI